MPGRNGIAALPQSRASEWQWLRPSGRGKKISKQLRNNNIPASDCEVSAFADVVKLVGVRLSPSRPRTAHRIAQRIREQPETRKGSPFRACRGSEGQTMRKHILTSICGGLILGTISIGAPHSVVGASMEIVNRTHKGDRMPLAQVNITLPLDQPIAGAYDLPDGCDPWSVLSRIPSWHAIRTDVSFACVFDAKSPRLR
jgi:hypothetical protein